MTIHQTGSVQNTQLTFPRGLNLSGTETQETNGSDAYAPRETMGQDERNVTQTYVESPAEGNSGDSVTPSWFQTFASGIALTLAGLALLPTIANATTSSKADASPQKTEVTVERVISPQLPSTAVEEMRVQDVLDEVRRTAGDLKSLDDSPEQVLVEQNGMPVSAGLIDTLAGRGKVGVGSPHKVSEFRSVSGTMSYDPVTGKPQMMYAEVVEDNGDSLSKKLVEYREEGDFNIYKVSGEKRQFEVKLNRKAPVNDIIRSFSDGDVMSEISRTAEDLMSLDDSPNEVLVEQNGMYVSAGKVDNVAGKGEVGVGSLYMVKRSRGVYGTMSYNPETGEPRLINAQVQERMGRDKVNKSIEYTEDAQSRTYKISTRDASFEIKTEK